MKVNAALGRAKPGGAALSREHLAAVLAVALEGRTGLPLTPRAPAFDVSLVLTGAATGALGFAPTHLHFAADLALEAVHQRPFKRQLHFLG
jgi:hypothetical protein